MKITADTNVLLRAVVGDDARQAAMAQALLLQATVIAVPVPVFCEFAWVLQRGYGYGTDEIAGAIEAIAAIDAVVTDSPAVEADWPRWVQAVILPMEPSPRRANALAGPCSRASIGARSLGSSATERTQQIPLS